MTFLLTWSAALTVSLGFWTGLLMLLARLLKGEKKSLPDAGGFRKLRTG
jgi:hypothetical protein